MKALVTGGLGFIGSHLVDALVAAGDHVTVIDNEAHSVIAARDSLAQTVHRCSVAYGYHESYLSSVDYIYHLASPCGVRKLDATVCARIVKDGEYVLKMAQRLQAKLVAFSTSEVIGRPEMHTEESHLEVRLPYSVRSQYQIGKMAMECMLLSSGYPDVQIIRPFNVIGPRQSPEGGFVLARFIQQAKARKPLTVFFMGTQRRAFVHVRDVVRFLLILRERWPTAPGIWHIANPKNTVSIGYLASLVSSINNPTKVRTVYVVDPAKELGFHDYWDAPEKFADISKAQAYGWEPEVSLEATVKELLNEV